MDEQDYERLSRFKWHCKFDGKRFDPKCWLGDERREEKMSRMILGLKPGDKLVADHINGDPLDNRRCNLRVATYSQNNMNSRARSAHGLKGIVFRPGRRRNPWYASITVNGSYHYLGGFQTKEEAYKAYCDAAREMFREFAKL